MKVHQGLSQLPLFRNPVLTIGTFDGVHTGHATLIQRMKKRAAAIQGETVLISFHPHPRFVLSGHAEPISLLSSLNEKADALEQLGVDHFVIVPFTPEFAAIPAADYLEHFLWKYFKPAVFIIGYDHRFGRNREGNFAMLEKASHTHGFELEEINMQELEQLAVSSTRIRNDLKQGELERANRLLGRPYTLYGQVIRGNQVGRTLGFPTANIQPDDEHKLIPMNGVYIVRAQYGEQFFGAMMNIGVRPTLQNGTQRHIEVHLFGFEGNLYAQLLKLDMVFRIRSEIKFSDLESLKKQIQNDREVSVHWLRTHYPDLPVPV